MRPAIVCVAVPTLVLLVPSLLAPAGWAQGLAAEVVRGADASGLPPAGGPVGHAPHRDDGGLLYLTSVDAGENDTFAVYDPATDTWTTLTDYDTGCQMAVSAAGELYAFRRQPPQIEVYDPGTDSWSYVMDGPWGASGWYCNLEITREGQFLYTEFLGLSVYYTTGSGGWDEFSVPFTTNVMGDYDSTTHQYVIGREGTVWAYLIDLATWTFIEFSAGGDNYEPARFGSVMGGRYYWQAEDDIFSYDLSDTGLPPQDHGYPGYYTSSAADRANQVIYVASYGGGQLWRFDPAAGTLTPLAGQGSNANWSSLAFVPPGDDQLPFADGFESGDTSAWSAMVP